MKCYKCHSPRLIRFLDGFGKKRIFCRSCQESVLIEEISIAQRKLTELNIHGGWNNGRISANTGEFNIR
ncbi:MAG: hypothetical protein J4428_02525 [Candidatus Aenigmarchaeota archaeon]|nr:hypothetical protein [Candidatus Aenigmarchaeota archaeon]